MAIKPRPNKHADVQQRLTLTPRESVKLTRFGLNHTYELLKRGEMPAIRIGKRFFIPKSALLKWLEQAGSNPLVDSKSPLDAG
jgi:excisionase family DNA binding protein